MSVPSDLPPTPPPPQRGQESKNALVGRFRKLLHLLPSERKLYKRSRDVGLFFLDFAATVAGELKKATKIRHGVNLGSALVIGALALPDLVRRIKKTAKAVLECRSLNKEIAAQKEKLACIQEKKDRIPFEIKIERLEKRRRKCIKQLPASHKIFVGTVEIAAAVVIAAYRIGSLAHKLSEHTATALCSASAVLGTTIGTIGIVIGGFEITRGVQKAFRARKKLREIQDQKKERLESKTGIDTQVWTLCTQIRSQKLSWQEINARRVYTSSILRACNGGLATVGGALAIAGVFTMGWTAIALGIVALSIGLVEIGVGIGSHIRGRQLKAEMKKKEISRDQIKDLGKQLEKCSPDQKKEIAQILGIGNIKAFAISPTKILKHEYEKVVELKGEKNEP